MRSAGETSFVLGLLVFLASLGINCEPGETTGAELVEIKLTLTGKNPSGNGQYILSIGERASLRATGIYENGSEENISLALFWELTPAGPADLVCAEDEWTGTWVQAVGLLPGVAHLSATTRQEDGTEIPCSPEPDGGWEFQDAGSGWPMRSNSITLEVR